MKGQQCADLYVDAVRARGILDMDCGQTAAGKLRKMHRFRRRFRERLDEWNGDAQERVPRLADPRQPDRRRSIRYLRFSGSCSTKPCFSSSTRKRRAVALSSPHRRAMWVSPASFSSRETVSSNESALPIVLIDPPLEPLSSLLRRACARFALLPRGAKILNMRNKLTDAGFVCKSIFEAWVQILNRMR